MVATSVAFRRFKAEGEGLNAILIVEQNIDLMQTAAHRAYVLDKGRVVASITRDELRDTERVAAFLAV